MVVNFNKLSFYGEPYHIELTHTDSSPNNCPSSAKPNCDTPIHLSNYYHDEQAHNTHRQTTSNSFHFVKKNLWLILSK